MHIGIQSDPLIRLFENCNHSCLQCDLVAGVCAEFESCMQGARQAARAEKLAAIRAGTAKSSRTNEVRNIGKKFYKQMISDSDYQGEDYEVFAKWLSQGHGEVKTDE